MALSPAPPHPHTPLPPPPALAGSPLGKQLLEGNKEALKCSPPQLCFSQMSSCLHPQGPVPWGVDRPSLWWGGRDKLLQVPGGNSRPWWYSLHRKQDLWKLLPSHCTSSAKYTVFWHTPHLLPPPQLGILEKNTKIRMRHGEGNRLPAAGGPPRGWSVLGAYFWLVLKTGSSHYWQMYVCRRVCSSYLILFPGELLCVGPMLGTLYNKITRDEVHKEHAGAVQAS